MAVDPQSSIYVTRYELDLHLGPMKEDIAEIKKDVKSLLGFRAGARALSTFQRWLLGTVGVGVLGALATLVWLASSSGKS